MAKAAKAGGTPPTTTVTDRDKFGVRTKVQLREALKLKDPTNRYVEGVATKAQLRKELRK